jgi:hypothetical protein
MPRAGWVGDLGMSVLRVIHAIPGRVRMEVPALKGNGALAQVVCDELGGREEITGVHANPVTGSLIVHYDCRRVPTLGAFHKLIEPVQSLFPETEGLS